jgi:ABC-type lipoprotein export system ATPase subunit
MQTYNVRLQSAVSDSFRCQRAANSLDIDTAKKSIHELSISADIDSSFNVGLVVGSSGSGKTTLAKKIFGEEIFKSNLDLSKPIIDQFPEDMSYDDCASALSGIGLTSVPCWIRPVYTLSNGQMARAEAALALCRSGVVVLDEWTSVVDRTVAKVMSHCVQKFARRTQKKVILLSCHYDVIEWLNPDWVIDCNHQKFIDRRLLLPEERRRQEKLNFEIKPTDSSAWKYFSKYHYLSERPLGGRVHHFGLFKDGTQVGTNCLANYVPWTDKSKPMIVHVSRTVIHPDYAGMGLGIKLDTAVSRYGKEELGYRVLAKFSSVPFYKMMVKDPANWRLLKVDRQIGKTRSGLMGRTLKNSSKHRTTSSFRENVKTYTFEFIG